MLWSVFVDLARELSTDEQAEMFEALERLVPDGGCIGPQKSRYEVFFVVEAPSSDDARRQAGEHMTAILRESRIDVAYSVEVHPRP
jgi:hypothetical protein